MVFTSLTGHCAHSADLPRIEAKSSSILEIGGTGSQFSSWLPLNGIDLFQEELREHG